MQKHFLVLIISILLICSSCKDDEPTINLNPTNILLIIADDMGLDATPRYDIGALKPIMPNLESMMDNGLRFNNVWANPVCTPTRASILTGKYGFRTNVLNVGDYLLPSETSLQSFISQQSNSNYDMAVLGKWHLGDTDPNHPSLLGVPEYAGLLSGAVSDYANWQFTSNGSTNNNTEYSTTKFTDLAIDWINNRENPWFLWLAYNAPHTPFHVPPLDLHSQTSLLDDTASINANPLPYYLAMLEALDTEIGRLFSSIPQEVLDNSIIIFIGDNGTPNQVAQDYPSNRVKGSVYSGGVNVPMVVSGKNVNRRNEVENALINSTDLFATIADLAGTNTTNINDSRSFKNLLSDPSSEKREYIYSEIGRTAGTSDITIRNQTHKYILFSDGSEGFFNLTGTFQDQPNLLNPNQLPLSSANEVIFQELKDEMESLRE